MDKILLKKSFLVLSEWFRFTWPFIHPKRGENYSDKGEKKLGLWLLATKYGVTVEYGAA